MTDQGFSVVELVITVGLVGVLSAVVMPTADAVLRRNRLAAGADVVESQLRSARLSALNHNARVRVAFDCPAAGAMRILAVTGNATIDDAVDRCSTDQPNDAPAVFLPGDVSFGDAPTLEFNGRGIVTAIGGTVPADISVLYGDQSRTFVVTGTGRISVSHD